MKILIFTEGTLIMPKAGQNLIREELVRQNVAGNAYFADFANYVPTINAVEKIRKWQEQGAEIYYLTSRTEVLEIDTIRQVLRKYHFPSVNNLHFRRNNQTYAEVGEELKPDVLIEDDCESIGGEVEMTYPHMSEKLQPKIKSVVVKEFAGIDGLPDEIENLLTVGEN